MVLVNNARYDCVFRRKPAAGHRETDFFWGYLYLHLKYMRKICVSIWLVKLNQIAAVTEESLIAEV